MTNPQPNAETTALLAEAERIVREAAAEVATPPAPAPALMRPSGPLRAVDVLPPGVVRERAVTPTGAPADDTGAPAVTHGPPTWLLLLAGLLLGVAILVALSWGAGGTSLGAPMTRPASTAAPATPTGAATAATADERLRLPNAVIAYAAPDGDPLGALEAGRPYQAVGRYGQMWVQAEVEGSGSVWVRADALDVTAAALGDLPDLAPPPTATPLPTATGAPVVAPVAPMVAPAPDLPPCNGPTYTAQAPLVQGGIRVENCISQAEANRALDAIVAATAAAK